MVLSTGWSVEHDEKVGTAPRVGWRAYRRDGRRGRAGRGGAVFPPNEGERHLRVGYRRVGIQVGTRPTCYLHLLPCDHCVLGMTPPPLAVSHAQHSPFRGFHRQREEVRPALRSLDEGARVAGHAKGERDEDRGERGLTHSQYTSPGICATHRSSGATTSSAPSAARSPRAAQRPSVRAGARPSPSSALTRSGTSMGPFS